MNQHNPYPIIGRNSVQPNFNGNGSGQPAPRDVANPPLSCPAAQVSGYRTWVSDATVFVDTIDHHLASFVEDSANVVPNQTMMRTVGPTANVWPFTTIATTVSGGVCVKWECDPLAAFTQSLLIVAIAQIAEYLNPVLATRAFSGYTNCRGGRLWLPFLSTSGAGVSLVHGKMVASDTTVSVTVSADIKVSVTTFGRSEWCQLCSLHE